jgi:hypothetical protein
MKSRRYVLIICLPLVLAVAVASLAGLLFPETYAAETPDWTAQAVAQDAVDLFLVLPLLTISTLFVFHGQRLAQPVWGGTLFYLIYTFIIYAFDVQFNSMFLVYVAALGLSAYGFIAFMRLPSAVKTIHSNNPPKVIGWYFIAIALVFNVLWLSEIIPSIRDGVTPATILKAGLATNPVHVIDLSFLLPGIFIVGVLMLRHQPIALKLAPVLLVFFVLMDITIAVIVVVQGNNEVATFLIPGLMALLALASGILLSWLMSRSSG